MTIPGFTRGGFRGMSERMQSPLSPRDVVDQVLRRETPPRIVYAPNYWQWFTHHHNHGLFPAELQDCRSQLDLLRHLGLDVFSRNVYCDPVAYWFGHSGMASERWDGVEVTINRYQDGNDTVTEKQYRTKGGELSERLRYVHKDSTLVQEKFVFDPLSDKIEAFDALVRGRTWDFDAGNFRAWTDRVGEDGRVNLGELFSPLKLLHLAAGPMETVFLLEDHPELCREWMAIHEAAQLDLLSRMLAAGARSVIAMDNLDAAFHSPKFVERFSASFYEKASRLCHASGATFFIHACGRQRPLLALIASLGVDGLEGVAFPSLGDVELDDAMRLSGDRLIITGGISAMETEKFTTRDQVRRHVEDLFRRMQPYRHRFMLSSSCNTSIRTPWETLVWFRDAWQEFG